MQSLLSAWLADPTICTVSFASFICKQISPQYSVLEADDTTLCEDPEHFTIEVLSGVVVVVFAFGLPVVFGYILVSEARDYVQQSAGTNAALVRRVADDLGVGEVAAGFVIRDVIIGEEYSFLMDACECLLEPCAHFI